MLDSQQGLGFFNSHWGSSCQFVGVKLEDNHCHLVPKARMRAALLHLSYIVINIVVFMQVTCLVWGLLRHCATSRKVMGLIPERVLRFSIDLLLSAAQWPQGRLSL